MCFLSTITRRLIAMWSHAARERVHEGQKRAGLLPALRVKVSFWIEESGARSSNLIRQRRESSSLNSMLWPKNSPASSAIYRLDEPDLSGRQRTEGFGFHKKCERSRPCCSASYLITLSALASTSGGIVKPICFAA